MFKVNMEIPEFYNSIKQRLKEGYVQLFSGENRKYTIAVLILLAILLIFLIITIIESGQNDKQAEQDSGKTEKEQSKTSDNTSSQSKCSNLNKKKCPPSYCEGDYWIEYPEYVEDECNKGIVIEKSCLPISSLPSEKCMGRVNNEQTIQENAELTNDYFNSYTSYNRLESSPIDGLTDRIREEKKDHPDYIAIESFLEYAREAASDKRPWTEAAKSRAGEYIEDYWIVELDKQIKNIKGVRKVGYFSSYSSINDLTAAIKEDTKEYIDSAAINSFLDHVKNISDNKGPWTEGVAGRGYLLLEEYWVNEIALKVYEVKGFNKDRSDMSTYALVNEIGRNTTEYPNRAEILEYLNYVRRVVDSNGGDWNPESLEAGYAVFLDTYWLDQIYIRIR